ncbi:CoA-binding protein [Enteractinococcus coprophilus]|uniref:CoA-binding domain-containing protein n=1 Tax=Enteractinococcus coprophilus TaxID=1027633 RepID=A0A543AG25_9MICC|nr:CoA-binding protein [Enteractinococcus coprophilus]TQL71528.1 hypothetical protein FB556_2016 [Enteractinococcus coprophilus]
MTQLSNRPQTTNDPEFIASLLGDAGATWAVVGLTDSPDRVAKPIASFLKSELGMNVVPVNLRREPVNGDRAFGRIAEIPFDVDVVHVFVNGAAAVGVVAEVIRKGIKTIWFQKDVDGAEAVDAALKAGMNVVVDTCPSIEGRMRSLGWRM